MAKGLPARNTSRRTPTREAAQGTNDADQALTDDLIQQTNSSSIVSKRSVEKLYYANEPEYFRHFVGRFKRRSPLINRGYWLRMRAIEHTVERFLDEPISQRKVVINLGCGYDPLPWLFFGKRKHLCDGVKFFDVDYPALMHKKVEIMKRTPELQESLPDLAFTSANSGVLIDSPRYAAIGCDLRDLNNLRDVLEGQGVEHDSVAILFVAEVSIAYMDLIGSQAVIQFARSYANVRFCLLEQHLPDGKDHPFAQTMLNHFDKLRTHLHSIGTMADMKKRFIQAGWQEDSVDIRSLWQLWSDSTFLTGAEKRALDLVEPFDEWEEFALFCSHYFLLVARSDDARIVRRPEAYSDAICTGDGIVCEEVESAPCQRRFAALLPDDPMVETSLARGLVGGLGRQERLTDTVAYVVGDSEHTMAGPPLRQGLMCHTITTLQGEKAILVGGRTSPDRACKDCWLRSSGTWRKVDDLPEARYRHSAVSLCTNGHAGVLVFAGRSSSGQLFSDFLFWTEQQGWAKLATNVAIEARYGATLVRTSESMEGLLFGGMNDDRNICEDVWRWYFDDQTQTIKLEPHERYNKTQDRLLPSDSICRFGAQTFSWKSTNGWTTMLAGGIGCNGLVPRAFEFLDLESGQAHPLRGKHPLLIGTSMGAVQSEGQSTAICLGGGATCFSFGTYWNKSALVLHFENAEYRSPAWRLCADKPAPSQMVLPQEDRTLPPAVKTEVQIIHDLSGSCVQELLKNDRPAILRGCDIGPCTSLWTPDYLKAALGTREVVVHSSNSPRMDFQTKNFCYETRAFSDFIDSALSGELLYMRALSSEAPADKPTDLGLDFPQIAQDFTLPPELAYVNENAHSRPLRISGKTIMWLHYDVMANVLCQIRGSKTLMLFPPADVAYLGIEPGTSSSSLDVFDTQSSLSGCHPYEARLQPGDILFIPALWLHAAAPEDGLSVAVNVFFRHLKEGYAAGKDVYGNRDLAAYERGRRDVARIIKSLSGLPPHTREHYLGRLSSELECKGNIQVDSAVYGSDSEAWAIWGRARKDVARIERSLRALPQSEASFYRTRLVLELRQHPRG